MAIHSLESLSYISRQNLSDVAYIHDLSRAPTFVPTDPEERLKLWVTMTEMVKADMAAGTLKDWGIRSGMMSGYGITSDISVMELDQFLLKWMPYIKFQTNPVLTADQNIEALKKVAEMMKK